MQAQSPDTMHPATAADVAIQASAGKLVVFPGWLQHYVPMQRQNATENMERIVIAGNFDFDPMANSIFGGALPLPAVVTAPIALRVSGLNCHPGANGDYIIQPQNPVAGKPHYTLLTAAEPMHLYWRSPEMLGDPLVGAWVIDAHAVSTQHIAVSPCINYHLHLHLKRSTFGSVLQFRKQCFPDWID